jgi:hypothetical protein
VTVKSDEQKYDLRWRARPPRRHQFRRMKVKSVVLFGSVALLLIPKPPEYKQNPLVPPNIIMIAHKKTISITIRVYLDCDLTPAPCFLIMASNTTSMYERDDEEKNGIKKSLL